MPQEETAESPCHVEDDIAGQIVCVLPDGFQMSEGFWSTIYREWKAKCERGIIEPLTKDDVLELFNREHQ